jgi:hypothetical protein
MPVCHTRWAPSGSRHLQRATHPDDLPDLGLEAGIEVERSGDGGERAGLEEGHRLGGLAQQARHEELARLQRQRRFNLALLVEDRQVIDRKRVAPEDAREGVEAAHGALGHRHLGAAHHV